MSIVPYSTLYSNVATIEHEAHQVEEDYFHLREESDSHEEEQEVHYHSPWSVAMNEKWNEYSESTQGLMQQRILIDIMKESFPDLECGKPSPFDTDIQVSRAQRDLMSYYKSQVNADVVLHFPTTDNTEEKSIPCHSWVLSCHSQYYNTFFNSYWFSHTNNDPDVTANGIGNHSWAARRVEVQQGRYQDMLKLVEYCYGGDFPCYHRSTTEHCPPTDSEKQDSRDRENDAVTEIEDILHLLQLVHRLVVPGLFADVLQDIGERRLTHSSVCAVLIVAISLDLAPLKEKCMSCAGELLHLHLRHLQRLDASFDEVCALASKHLLHFEQLPVHTQASLFSLQRTFRRYQQSFGCTDSGLSTGAVPSDAISARELLCILAECLEEDEDRYQTAWGRLQEEVRAFISKLHQIGRQHMFGKLFLQLSNVTTYTTEMSDSTLDINTNSMDRQNASFVSMFGLETRSAEGVGDISSDMLQWRDRVLKVDAALERQRALIAMQKEFYLEQRSALSGDDRQHVPAEAELG